MNLGTGPTPFLFPFIMVLKDGLKPILELTLDLDLQAIAQLILESSLPSPSFQCLCLMLSND